MKVPRGFTLPELMVTAGVITLVAAIGTVGISRHREDAEDARTQAELTSVYKAMEAYRQVYGRYPRNSAEIRPFVSIADFDRKYEINPNP